MNNKKFRSVLLIDDDEPSNMINERVIKKADFAENVMAVTSGLRALSHLNKTYDGKQPLPQLIFLDINMPAMNGWEFIEEFNKMPYAKNIIIVMLTTSLNPDDAARAKSIDAVDAFRNKPLTISMLQELSEMYLT